MIGYHLPAISAPIGQERPLSCALIGSRAVMSCLHSNGGTRDNFHSRETQSTNTKLNFIAVYPLKYVFYYLFNLWLISAGGGIIRSQSIPVQEAGFHRDTGGERKI